MDLHVLFETIINLYDESPASFNGHNVLRDGENIGWDVAIKTILEKLVEKFDLQIGEELDHLRYEEKMEYKDACEKIATKYNIEPIDVAAGIDLKRMFP